MRIEDIHWNSEKDQQLRKSRGISFENIVPYILQGDILDVYDHPN